MVKFKFQLTHFMSLASFYTPWKHKKIRGFLMLKGGGAEKDQLDELGEWIFEF